MTRLTPSLPFSLWEIRPVNHYRWYELFGSSDFFCLSLTLRALALSATVSSSSVSLCKAFKDSPLTKALLKRQKRAHTSSFLKNNSYELCCIDWGLSQKRVRNRFFWTLFFRWIFSTHFFRWISVAGSSFPLIPSVESIWKSERCHAWWRE